jgi:hypothetical protein
MLKPITISAVIILSHISLKMFDLIFAMTGPDNGETGHPALNMYLTTFRANDFAKGAAIAIVLFIVAATFHHSLPDQAATGRREALMTRRSPSATCCSTVPWSCWPWPI